jgi:hypothetical protein
MQHRTTIWQHCDEIYTRVLVSIKNRTIKIAVEQHVKIKAVRHMKPRGQLFFNEIYIGRNVKYLSDFNEAGIFFKY